LERRSGRIFSRDGFAVACEIEFEDPLETFGAEIVKELSGKINRQVGDGTTTAVVFLSSLIKEGHRLIRGGIEPVPFIKGMKSALEEAEAVLSAISLPVNRRYEIEKLASLAVHGDPELTGVVSGAILSSPKGCTIVVEDGPGVSSYVDFKPGLSVDGGFASSSSLSSEEVTWELPQVAVFGKGISRWEDITPVAEEASQWPHPLVIVAPYIHGDALKTMGMNPNLNGQPWTAVKYSPHWKYGEGRLRDLLALTGATLVSEEMGNSPRKFKPEWLGFCQRVKISSEQSIFTGTDESQDRITRRVRELRGEIERLESAFDKKILEKQISMILGGLCHLYVGAVTEEERKEKRSRVEDALFAVKAGLEGGIVPGAGSSFLTARDFILSREPGEDDFFYGRRAFCRALEEPVMALLRNSQKERGDLESLYEKRGEKYNPWLGWDLVCDEIVDCKERGIWDTKKGVQEILRGAFSAASVFLNSGAVVWKRK